MGGKELGWEEVKEGGRDGEGGWEGDVGGR